MTPGGGQGSGDQLAGSDVTVPPVQWVFHEVLVVTGRFSSQHPQMQY